jgi:hypothetical protein
LNLSASIAIPFSGLTAPGDRGSARIAGAVFAYCAKWQRWTHWPWMRTLRQVPLSPLVVGAVGAGAVRT